MWCDAFGRLVTRTIAEGISGIVLSYLGGRDLLHSRFRAFSYYLFEFWDLDDGSLGDRRLGGCVFEENDPPWREVNSAAASLAPPLKLSRQRHRMESWNFHSCHRARARKSPTAAERMEDAVRKKTEGRCESWPGQPGRSDPENGKKRSKSVRIAEIGG